MKQALACEKDASHAPTAQAVQLAIQACTVYLHQAAVLREKNLSVDVRYGVYAQWKDVCPCTHWSGCANGHAGLPCVPAPGRCA